MTNEIISLNKSLGNRHRIVICENCISIEHIDLNTKMGWDTNICFWKEDIDALKKAIKIFEKKLNKK